MRLSRIPFLVAGVTAISLCFNVRAIAAIDFSDWQTQKPGSNATVDAADSVELNQDNNYTYANAAGLFAYSFAQLYDVNYLKAKLDCVSTGDDAEFKDEYPAGTSPDQAPRAEIFANNLINIYDAYDIQFTAQFIQDADDLSESEGGCVFQLFAANSSWGFDTPGLILSCETFGGASSRGYIGVENNVAGGKTWYDANTSTTSSGADYYMDWSSGVDIHIKVYVRPDSGGWIALQMKPHSSSTWGNWNVINNQPLVKSGDAGSIVKTGLYSLDDQAFSHGEMDISNMTIAGNGGNTPP
jgi:hypothetical protein